MADINADSLNNPVTFDLAPIVLRSSNPARSWSIPLILNCVPSTNGSAPWDASDVQYIEVPEGGIISVSGDVACAGPLWVGSGKTDLGFLGIGNNLKSLQFIRWTAEAPGSDSFVLTTEDGTTLSSPARNNVLNFDGSGFPNNALRKLHVPTGFTAYVFDLPGASFSGSQVYYNAGDHDLANDNFADKTSSMWLIRSQSHRNYKTTNK